MQYIVIIEEPELSLGELFLGPYDQKTALKVLADYRKEGNKAKLQLLCYVEPLQ